MEDSEFEEIVDRALEELPQEFKDKLDNVAVITANWPTKDQVRSLNNRSGVMLLGLYQGIPQTRRRSYGVGPTLPDKITIFKYPILRISRSYKDAVNNIKDTVMHEIAHHFGMNDEEIHRAKRK